MNKLNGHNKITGLSSFFQYLKGKMNARDEHAFERHILNDPFESDALDGFKNFEEEDLSKDLVFLKSKIQKDKDGTVRIINRKSVAIAASVIVILGLLSVLLLLQPEQPQLVSQKIEPVIQQEKSSPEKEDQLDQPNSEVLQEEDRIVVKPEDKVLADKVTLADAELELADESESIEKLPSVQASKSKVRLASSKKVEINSFNVEPQSFIESNQKRTESDSGNNHLYGTLKGEEFIGGGTGQIDMVSIQGKVKDKYQHPVAGANIQVKGTSHATLSNADGSYRLKFPINDTAQPVTASFIGYVPTEIAQNSNDTIDFTLNEEFFALSEIQTISPKEEKPAQTEDFVTAEPEIGMDEYLDELVKGMRYPADGSGKKETVVALVILSDDGDIKDIHIKRSPGHSYSVEAIRLIKNGPLWKPAYQFGVPVQDEVKVKIQFIPPTETE
nr:carboxypeptidase-like regulatory domain-containing protein [uncultured Carboxylicivirga sp.]